MQIKSKQPLYISQLPTMALGAVWIAATERGLAAIMLGAEQNAFSEQLARRLNAVPREDRERTALIAQQLAEYLAGQRQVFNLPIDWALTTPFQRRVLELQITIPYGETRTYGQLARQLGNPRAARAVGRAGAANPIAIVIPCHRVIGADGSLRGYAAPGGIETKAWLLALEQGKTRDLAAYK